MRGELVGGTPGGDGGLEILNRLGIKVSQLQTRLLLLFPLQHQPRAATLIRSFSKMVKSMKVIEDRGLWTHTEAGLLAMEPRDQDSAGVLSLVPLGLGKYNLKV